MSKKLIFDYYLDSAKLEHIVVKCKQKKIVKIPFYFNINSKEGYYLAGENDEEKREEFFSMMAPAMSVTQGFDSITGLKQKFPFFVYFEIYRPICNTNLGLFSSITLIEKNREINILDKFMGISLDDYDYLNNDIYYDYHQLDENRKSLITTAIRKYCNLYFIYNFLTAFDSEGEKELEFYYSRYLMLVKIIKFNIFPTFYIENVITKSYEIFNQEDNIYKLTAYKYIPDYLNVKKKFNYQDIFEYLKIEEIELRIKDLNSKAYSD